MEIDAHNYGALHACINTGNTQAAQMLLERGMDFGHYADWTKANAHNYPLTNDKAFETLYDSWKQNFEGSDSVRSEDLAAPVATPVPAEGTGETETPAEPTNTATALEILWRNQANLELTLGITATDTILNDLAPDTVSDVLVNNAADGSVRYYLVQISGREMRPVTESDLNQQKSDIFSAWLQETRIDGFEDLGGWRNRAPRQPAIDPRYLVAQPTFTPEPVPTTVPEEAPAENNSDESNNSENTGNTSE